MKNNDYRKEFGIDEFARKYYCEHARLNQLRSDKKQAKRKSRRNGKNDIINYRRIIMDSNEIYEM